MCLSRLAILTGGSDRDLNKLGGEGGDGGTRSAWLTQVIRQATEA